ncbi:hypothetical protein [Rhizobium lusitanum]|uniref:hypothetical protein n=1 Tax=Rhizobium lusitanum TaxID=293958 RepID=UPI0019562D08|nr:hypothetical protein [Rhizobium lusitanum]MBM7049710.1 hypothetical protein [Rhizobium lusitanum]
MTGSRFGKLTVTTRADNSAHGKAMWNVICDCGTEKAVIGSSMTGGRTTSCGCAASERGEQRLTHGMSKSKEYQTWASMIGRCYIESATGYKNYGGRGIKVCDEWRNSFEAFFAHIGVRPSAQHSIDRYPDVDGNYEPGNVRWAISTDQARNKRNNYLVTINEETKTLAEWCESLGLPYGTISSRIRKLGWTPEEALGFRERAAA